VASSALLAFAPILPSEREKCISRMETGDTPSNEARVEADGRGHMAGSGSCTSMLLPVQEDGSGSAGAMCVGSTPSLATQRGMPSSEADGKACGVALLLPTSELMGDTVADLCPRQPSSRHDSCALLVGYFLGANAGLTCTNMMCSRSSIRPVLIPVQKTYSPIHHDR
jgi:hypothetical protein